VPDSQERNSINKRGSMQLDGPISPSGQQPPKGKPSNPETQLQKQQTDNQKIVPSESSSHKKKSNKTQYSPSKLARGKCTVQLNFIESLNEIAFTHYSNLTTEHLVILLDTLNNCYRISPDKDILQVVKPPNAISSEILDLLIREETTAISCYFRLLFRMYAEAGKDSSERIAISEPRLTKKCHEVLTEYIQTGVDVNNKYANNPEVEKVITAYWQIISQILKGILDLYDEQFMKHLAFFYPTMCELIVSPSKDLRQVLRDIFTKVGKMKNLVDM